MIFYYSSCTFLSSPHPLQYFALWKVPIYHMQIGYFLEEALYSVYIISFNLSFHLHSENEATKTMRSKIFSRSND